MGSLWEYHYQTSYNDFFDIQFGIEKVIFSQEYEKLIIHRTK